jgi:hypothetical protein
MTDLHLSLPLSATATYPLRVLCSVLAPSAAPRGSASSKLATHICEGVREPSTSAAQALLPAPFCNPRARSCAPLSRSPGGLAGPPGLAGCACGEPARRCDLVVFLLLAVPKRPLLPPLAPLDDGVAPLRSPAGSRPPDDLERIWWSASCTSRVT